MSEQPDRPRQPVTRLCGEYLAAGKMGAPMPDTSDYCDELAASLEGCYKTGQLLAADGEPDPVDMVVMNPPFAKPNVSSIPGVSRIAAEARPFA